MTHARGERTALCDLLDRLGPEAPTLCTGWTTYDLAAHLALRERSLAPALMPAGNPIFHGFKPAT